MEQKNIVDTYEQIVKENKILQGSTLAIIDTDSVYNGIYFIRISNGNQIKSFKVIIAK